MLDQQLAGELHRQIIKKIKKRKVQAPSIHNIWGASLANKEICFLFSLFDIFSKYGSVNPFNDKIFITVTIFFKKNLR